MVVVVNVGHEDVMKHLEQLIGTCLAIGIGIRKRRRLNHLGIDAHWENQAHQCLYFTRQSEMSKYNNKFT